MKKLIFILIIILTTSASSQEKFTKSFKIVSDNDLYTSTKNDRYYSNGLFLSFNYLSNKRSEKLQKKILEWTIGHEMYSPYKAVVPDIFLHDRPFAAYLFASFGYQFVYKNHQNLKTTIQIGVLGKNAFGSELQNFVHDIYGFKRAVGWEFQIKDAIALNLNANYVKHLGMDTTKHVDFNFVGNGRIGTVYTDLSAGFISRIGFLKLTEIANSMAFGTNLNNENTSFYREIESFLFIKPMFHAVLYDATLQGSFLNIGSLVTKDPKNFRFELEIGVQFTLKRVNLGYIYNYQTNKTYDLKYDNGNKFGRILISYLLH